MNINIQQERQDIRSALVSYFGDLQLEKCSETTGSATSGSYSLYYARIGCMLCIDDRYVIVVTGNRGDAIGNRVYLSSLNWVSFQTRTIGEPPRPMKTQELQSSPTSIINDTISLQAKKADRYTYTSDNYPLRVELLFTEDNDSYSERGTVQGALDTYNCLLSITI